MNITVYLGANEGNDPALRDAMLQNQHKGIHPDAADRIYDAVKAAVERRNA